MNNFLIKTSFLSISLFTSFAHTQGPSHFALECENILITEVETYEELNITIPVGLNEERDKGSYLLINYDVTDVENGGNVNKFNKNGIAWVGGIVNKNNLSKTKLINDYYAYEESTNDSHIFERWNEDVYLNTKKREQTRFWGREKLSIDREKLEVSTHQYFQRKDKEGELITNDYRTKYTSCRVVNASEESAFLATLNNEWGAIEKKLIEKQNEEQRLEEERVKAKNKI